MVSKTIDSMNRGNRNIMILILVPFTMPVGFETSNPSADPEKYCTTWIFHSISMADMSNAYYTIVSNNVIPTNF